MRFARDGIAGGQLLLDPDSSALKGRHSVLKLVQRSFQGRLF